MGAVWYFPPPPSPTIPACGKSTGLRRNFCRSTASFTELCAAHAAHWEIDTPTPLEEIAERMAQHQNVCTIVNLRAHARTLYQALARLCPEEEVFLLSTDLCPAHRTEVIQAIHRRQKEKLPCRVVSTQCIEAGVDLDFDCLYRALAPLEAIIQASGRCNRNGKSAYGELVVFVQRKIGCIPIPTMKTEQPSSAPCRCSNPLISTIQKSSATITGSCSARSGATKSPGHWKRPWPSGIFRQSPNSTV